jgi:hypothetical protein
MTHDELRRLVPIYALDALEGDEELEVRSHLEVCPICRDALEAHVQAAGTLALAVEPVQPPPDMRRRLLEAVTETEQADPAGPRPAAARRPRRVVRWEQVVAIFSAAAVLALGVFTYSLAQRLSTRDRQLARQNQVIVGLSSPLILTVPMVASGSAVKATGNIYVAADHRSAGLVATGLSDPGKRIYQLWLIVDNQPTPLEPFRPDPNGIALVPIQGNLAPMQGMAVTLEQRPNLPKPHGDMVLRTA